MNEATLRQFRKLIDEVLTHSPEEMNDRLPYLSAVLRAQKKNLGELEAFERMVGLQSRGAPAAEDPLARAVSILSKKKVLKAERVAKVWSVEPPQNVPLRYTDETFREAARQNKETGADWRLVYIHGFSFREQREKVGFDPKRQPCYYANDWWLKSEEDDWAMGKAAPGYYLIDFNGRFGRTSWANQRTAIEKLGPQYERADECMVAEAIISIFELTGERLLENWWHWGYLLTSHGSRVWVGRFSRLGLLVSRDQPDWDSHDLLRVSLAWKF